MCLCMCAYLLSRVELFVTPLTLACQAPRPWAFPGKSSGVEL